MGTATIGRPRPSASTTVIAYSSVPKIGAFPSPNGLWAILFAPSRQSDIKEKGHGRKQIYGFYCFGLIRSEIGRDIVKLHFG